MDLIPNRVIDLSTEEMKVYAFLATTILDESPQVTKVWLNTDGLYRVVESATDRVKDHNTRASPKVPIQVSNPNTPYRNIQNRCRAIEIIEKGRWELMDAISKKFTSNVGFRLLQDIRLTFKIQIDNLNIME